MVPKRWASQRGPFEGLRAATSIRAEALRPHAHAQFQARLDCLVRDAAQHPKMAALLETVLAHFRSDAESRGPDTAGGDPSRVIIFTNLRDSVQAICDVLRPARAARQGQVRRTAFLQPLLVDIQGVRS